MQKIQNEYEKNLDRKLLHEILKHRLHAFVVQEVTFHMMLNDVLTPPQPKVLMRRNPSIFELVFYCKKDLIKKTSLGHYFVVVTHIPSSED
jgi:hypothetical protein